MTLSVHLLRLPYTQDTLALLRARLHPEVRLSTGLELPTPPEYQILVAGRPEEEHLTASPNLQALIVPWAGIPEPTRQLMREYPHIAVHNLHHNALPAAELAITLLLAAAKLIIPMDRSMRAGDWTPRYEANPSVLLEGKTALILGFGAIGQRVAHLCRGLGMKVTVIRRHAEETPLESSPEMVIAPPGALHDLLPQANALIICLPHTDETTGLIDAEALALLPPRAVLVNIARGPIVDEAALYEALCDGTLHSAGLDVWYNYPAAEADRTRTPPSAFPFHELSNVVMSPHRGGASEETELLRVIHLSELLNTAARGEPMPNRVDLEAGY